MTTTAERSDAIVVGAGLAGLVAACELVDAGRRVVVVDQEGPQSIGGQAFWSFGGLFLVDSPEQRRLKVRDSAERAWEDWQAAAGFDRLDDEDHWPRKWARTYVEWAAGPKREWLHGMGVRWFPVVGWAERGGVLREAGDGAEGYGNSVPRFHVTWGTGPAVVRPFEARLRRAEARGLVRFAWRHRVDGLDVTDGVVTGVRGAVLAADTAERGFATSRDEVGTFEFSADAVVVASGGIGANHELVRAAWPERMGTPPADMLTGVPAHVDGRMLSITEAAGARVVNRDRMWHYTEGIANWDPIWDRHGIRILPGPSSLWLDSTGERLPDPLWPGFDTLATLQHICTTGQPYTWFVLTQAIIEKEFALSGSEQNPDLTGKSVAHVLKRVLPGAPGPVEAFKQRGEDFVVRDTLEELVAAMNELAGPDAPQLDLARVRAHAEARDGQVGAAQPSDAQVAAIDRARVYLGDKLIRTAKPHRLLDPKSGPLIAVRLRVLTRKTLGGLNTDLESRVLDANGAPIGGLYAVGEVAGFGGGGLHGYRALEGTFLGGCLFSGRAAGRAIAGQSERLQMIGEVLSLSDTNSVVIPGAAWPIRGAVACSDARCPFSARLPVRVVATTAIWSQDAQPPARGAGGWPSWLRPRRSQANHPARPTTLHGAISRSIRGCAPARASSGSRLRAQAHPVSFRHSASGRSAIACQDGFRISGRAASQPPSIARARTREQHGSRPHRAGACSVSATCVGTPSRGGCRQDAGTLHAREFAAPIRRMCTRYRRCGPACTRMHLARAREN